ncbi:hypothetical protein ACFQQB_39140 [Nonomuraea rubra]|uniref:hypothetical protein n=1 Tax=Nonomuraea rubra TaxID=46180 RepID=UPI00361F75FE
MGLPQRIAGSSATSPQPASATHSSGGTPVSAIWARERRASRTACMRDMACP